MSADTPPANVSASALILYRLDQLSGQLKDLAVDVRLLRDTYDKRLGILEDRVTRVEERQGVLAMAQAAYTSIASLIAAILGVRQ